MYVNVICLWTCNFTETFVGKLRAHGFNNFRHKKNQWYLNERFCDVTRTHIGTTALWSHSWQRRIVQYSFLYKNYCLKDEEKELNILVHLFANAIDWMTYSRLLWQDNVKRLFRLSVLVLTIPLSCAYVSYIAVFIRMLNVLLINTYTGWRKLWNE
jgi:hypothetical protein